MKNKMKKLITLSAIVASTVFTGCVNNQPRVEYPTYKPVEKVKLDKKDIIDLTDGKLMYNNKTIMDADGNINFATLIDNKLYYMVSKIEGYKTKYVLKDENSKVIQEFDGTRGLIMKDVDGLPLILIEKGNNYVYGNVYRFDGKEVKLVNKNVEQYNNEVYILGYRFIKELQKDGQFSGSLIGWKPLIVSVVDNNSKKISVAHPRTFFGTPQPQEYRMITSSGANIIYSYKDSNGDSVIETHNLKTDSIQTLAKGDKTFCQLLYFGNKKILRILTNNNLTAESMMHGATPTSKYDNEPSINIDLDTLKEVEINIKDFNKYILKTGFSNLGGGYTVQNYITFSVSGLNNSNPSGGPLF